MPIIVDRDEAQRLVGAGAQFVEVLHEHEYAEEHLPGALHLSLKRLDAGTAPALLDASRPVIVYCWDALCDMSPRAAWRLERLGFGPVYDYAAGKVDWMAAGLPTVRADTSERRALDAADPDPPSCRPDDRVADVVGTYARSVVVVNDRVILLGRLNPAQVEAADSSPHPGRGWFRTGRPDRQRATYNRNHGTRKLLGAYDLGADRFWGRLEARSVTAKVVLEFLRDIRRRYPAETTVYIVMDNLSAHWTPEIRCWAIESNVGLLPTPTNASHLNRIERHFWAYVEFVINGSDHRDWTSFSKASQAYIRRRNRDRHDPRILQLENRRKVA